jgi:hypothetical protein
MFLRAVVRHQSVDQITFLDDTLMSIVQRFDVVLVITTHCRWHETNDFVSTWRGHAEYLAVASCTLAKEEQRVPVPPGEQSTASAVYAAGCAEFCLPSGNQREVGTHLPRSHKPLSALSELSEGAGPSGR